MKPKKIKDGVFFVGAVDWDRRLFDSLIPLPDGTSYNAYLIQGREKTVLIDTVDPSKSDVLMETLKEVPSIDFIVSQHAEQDHSGTLPLLLDKYKNAKVMASPKGKELLSIHLHIPADRIVTVNDGETLPLGGKTLEFLHTPWVHWPETMSTLLKEDRILFTCDLFGSHLAVSGLYTGDTAKVCESAKRYYAEVLMPFRSNMKKHMERFAKYSFDMIAPSHGPVHNDPVCIIESHLEWISDHVSNTVALPYVTMHGSTQLLADHLTEALYERGVNVDRFNLAVTDIGRLAMSLVDAATLVVGSPTVLLGAHPLIISAAFLANALKPKVKFASVIGSYGWGGKTPEQITATLCNLKVEYLPNVLVKGKPTEDDRKALEKLADGIAAKHRENNIS